MSTRAAATRRRVAAPPHAATWIALGALVLGATALALHLGRSTTFYFDDWTFIQDRRGWDLDALFAPHNEHLSLVPVLVYKLLFEVAGIESYTPYRVAGLVVHALVVVLLFLYARRRVGDLAALAAAAVVALLGQAWPDVLWPFQIGFLGSLAAGLGALLALDRRDRRGDVIAAILLTVALASSSLGIPLLAAAAIEVLLRPDRKRRWPVLAVPAVLYAAWYLNYGGEGHTSADNLFATPAYVLEAAAGAAGALFGLGPVWGRPLLIGLVVLLVLAVRRGILDHWRLTALIALPLVFWVLTGIARADLHEPAAPRYLYPGVLFLLLVAVEAARGTRIASRGGAAALLVTLALVTLAHIGALRDGAGYLRDQATELDGALAAMRLAAPHDLQPGFQPAPAVAPQIHAAAYLGAVDDLGSPAPSAAALPRLYERAREAADDTLARAYGVRLVPVLVKARAGACRRAPVDLELPAPGLVIASGGGTAKVQVRRFADVYRPAGAVTAGTVWSLTIPRDASSTPWQVRVTGSGPVRICDRG
jgi:hypothetical protein